MNTEDNVWKIFVSPSLHREWFDISTEVAHKFDVKRGSKSCKTIHIIVENYYKSLLWSGVRVSIETSVLRSLTA